MTAANCIPTYFHLQEMTVLTQHILQNALIKKKLEEQKENYRKKHEGKSVGFKLRRLCFLLQEKLAL